MVTQISRAKMFELVDISHDESLQEHLDHFMCSIGFEFVGEDGK